jgi:hypothetical protein
MPLLPGNCLVSSPWLQLSKSKLCYEQQSVGQSILVSSTHLWFQTIFITIIVLGLLMWGTLSLRGWIVYNSYWPMPAHSFLDPSPVGLMTVFYRLGFEAIPTWRARSPYLYLPGTGWPSFTHRHWVTFSSPPMIHRVTMEVFRPASTWGAQL